MSTKLMKIKVKSIIDVSIKRKLGQRSSYLSVCLDFETLRSVKGLINS
jgi:hypothetical protein